MIQYVSHQAINREKWDRCINRSPNGMIYALSWYLDEVCPGWTALVEGDYEQVMPLAVNRRLGISYVFTPYYAQQLGVFGEGINDTMIGDFINKIPSFIRLADIKLNEGNVPPEGQYTLVRKNNYLLAMETSYKDIVKRYNRNCRRNIKKAEDHGLRPGGSMEAEDFAGFIGSSLETQMEGLGKEAIRLLEKLTEKILIKNQGEVVTVVDATGRLCAAGSFLFQDERLIFSVCASSPEGKQQHAMYMLVDSQLKKYAGQYKWFDFSGSDLEGIAYFNSTFGARPVPYYLLHLNRLNWLQRILSGKMH